MQMDIPKHPRKRKMSDFVNYLVRITLIWAAVLLAYPLM